MFCFIMTMNWLSYLLLLISSYIKYYLIMNWIWSLKIFTHFVILLTLDRLKESSIITISYLISFEVLSQKFMNVIAMNGFV